MNKKICVVSSYAYIINHNNYGALLQYYAIEKFFKKAGYETFWVKFVLPHSNIFFYLGHLLHQEYKPALFLREIVCHSYFLRFCKKKITCTKKQFKSNDAIERDIPIADFYITGSDQVWGGILKPNFLCFVSDRKKKIAFAASFGRKELSESQKENGVSNWLKSFGNISVREKEGVEICKSLGIDAVQILDPTFLLSKYDYIQFHEKKKNRKKYMQCYFLNIENRQNVFFDLIEKFSKENEIKLKVTGVGESGMKFPARYYFYPSPEEWLSSYSMAEYIVTNTFHGTVFAIIFRRQFVTILQDGKMSRLNSRVFSILERFNLKSRIWDGVSDLKKLLETPIDWTTTEWEIEKNKEETRIFLEGAGL